MTSPSWLSSTRAPSLLFLTAQILLLSVSPAAASGDCTEEFGKCVTNRDCCGRLEEGDRGVECVAGDWEFTTDSTCLSKRSSVLDDLANQQGFSRDPERLAVLLKDFVYAKHPVIRARHEERSRQNDKAADDPSRFYEKIAEKYKHDFAKLVVGLERKYEITDRDALPKLIDEYLRWSDSTGTGEL
mmetsp:Transcript_60487/g.123416  ORF Transcript_60487/g.123416 Transcript_60487/m.123416 type:complete len:186 (-) Transcript_60487:1244-1801(-)